MSRNLFAGTCYRCQIEVTEGEGHFEKIRARDRKGSRAKWRVQHADCAIRWRGKPAPTVEEARAARSNAP